MPPLKHLEREYPSIDANFRDFCAVHGILSVEEFLLHDLYVLAAFADQRIDSVRLKEGITQLLSIIESQCQPWLNGLELLDNARRNTHLSTGNEGIDSLLQDGLRVGQLTELVGPSSSGKTQLCLQAATYVAEKHMGRVLYLDTGNSFSPRRIANFVGLTSLRTIDETRRKFLQRVMSRITCRSVFDIFAMFDMLHCLEFDLKSKMNIEDGRLLLLIVDSVSSLITPILGGNGSLGRALMISAGYVLKKLAHEHNLAVLVTNHTVGGEGGSTKPALGESWKSIPHVRLLLSRDHGSKIGTVQILKHTSMACGKVAKFMINDSE